MRLRSTAEVRALAARALAGGAKRVSIGTIRWDLSGDCERPYMTTVHGRPARSDWEPRYVLVNEYSEGSLVVEIETRCRACAKCLAARRRLWSHRAVAETQYAPRTWFGTITLSPENHFAMLTRARAAFAPNGDYDALPEVERFRLLDREIWREMSLMWKRIRKEYAAPMRYFVVAEAHKSGLPHYHALVHQVRDAPVLKYTALEGAWRLGFTKWRLVKSAAEARYTAKYLGKSLLARVRASQAYGDVQRHYGLNPSVNVMLPLEGEKDNDPQNGGGGCVVAPTLLED